MPRRLPDPGRRPLRAVAAALVLATAGCGLVGGGGGPQPGQPGVVTGFLGGVVADEPRAALIGREVLSAGGNAADAAVAVGFALSVTLPSRASLGAGGACLAYAPGSDSVNAGVPEAVLFTPLPGAAGGDRPAAVPMLPRGLFVLHARYGHLPFENLIVPAEQLARTGFRASRALVRDLQVVARPLLADPERPRDLRPQRQAAGGKRADDGAGAEHHAGPAAHRRRGRPLCRLVRAHAGGGESDHRRPAEHGAAAPGAAAPRTADHAAARSGSGVVSAPPADGGAAAAAALRVLARDPAATQAAQARALAVATRLRATGGDPMAAIDADLPAGGGGGPYPASTTFATLDRQGNAVVCALTMDNLFGTGRIVPGMGFLLAASPSRLPRPLLAAGLVWNQRQGFRAEAGGSGQEGAPLAAAYALLSSIRAGKPLPQPPPEPGRANVILCGDYLPGSEKSCGWATDPRGAGLAVGSDSQ